MLLQLKYTVCSAMLSQNFSCVYIFKIISMMFIDRDMLNKYPYIFYLLIIQYFILFMIVAIAETFDLIIFRKLKGEWGKYS